MKSKSKDNSHLYLVDGSGYIFRAYHALPPLTRKSDRMPVGAVSGFCSMLFKLVQEARVQEGAHLAIVFDAGSKSFRNKIYPEYKAHRPPTPEDLAPQFALTRRAVEAFGIVGMEMEDFEADDIIATYAHRARAQGMDVTILSSDKDLMQLVGDGVKMHDAMRGRHIGVDEVVEKFGVPPEKLLDLLSLAGDSVDNIPGVPGIGVKTAAQLLQEYGDMDTLLERAGEIKQTKRRENLLEYAEQARLSRRLVTLDCEAPVDIPVDSLLLEPPNPVQLIGFLKEMEFSTLTRRISQAWDIDADAIEATKTVAPKKAPKAKTKQDTETKGADAGRGLPGWTPSGLSEGLVKARDSYELVREVADLERWIAEAREVGSVAVDTETDSLDAMSARLVGVCMATAPGKACYIPLQHVANAEMELDLGEGASQKSSKKIGKQIPLKTALKLLKPLLEDESVLKIGQNIKFDFLVLLNHGICLSGMDDTMLMSYALDAGRGGHGMDALSERHLQHSPIPFKDIVGSGRKQVTFDKVPLEDACRYAAEDADVTLRLAMCLKPRLPSENMCTLYETLERPMPALLAQMEQHGIMVDEKLLDKISKDFAKDIKKIEVKIFKLAGREFNIASPLQLGKLMFEEMGLEQGRKTKTGAWATGADELERLAADEHELPRLVLEWRHYSKLKSTYADALPKFINPKTGRVHTCYSLASTSTGRLSSSDPNLQNIPIRTKEGRRFRAAFIAAPGQLLVSADYSQIELRVLAHMAGIKSLQRAFAEGLDIHAMTASEMFGVPLKKMDPETRYRAKAINFGIIYGISAHGLANQLGISRTEAGEYIDAYFKKFPGIRDYMESTKQMCREHGYVETLFGRRAHYPEINTKNPNQRAFLERAAINAPIQGSAADIIRRAMIRLPKALKDAGLSGRMLLQVHDELIFEVPKSEAKATCSLVSEVMARAPEPALKMDVDLEVSAKAARNWEEAH